MNIIEVVNFKSIMIWRRRHSQGELVFFIQDISIPWLGKSNVAVMTLEIIVFLDDDTVAGGHFSWLFMSLL